MSLVRKLASFATSPQGRRAIDQARTRLDTPQNREKLSTALGRVRSTKGRPAASPTTPPAPPAPPA